MKRTDFSGMYCSAARTLDIVGEWWTLLILRDLFLGNCRFNGLLASLGISKKVLTDRLDTMLAEGIVQLEAYGDGGKRFEYRLTKKGEELGPVLLSLMAWGDKWVFNNEPPVELTHTTCGHATSVKTVCDSCGEPINFPNLEGRPGSCVPEEEKERWRLLKKASPNSRMD